ncbi:LIM and SH3 domain protein Lasp [Acrasis kona]|uniref:LIM and SH3 domain protein Lasp n=1 Tax=Acrasis kona TaxID=1008807 RepID=A0AAW2YVM0_9EUKA
MHTSHQPNAEETFSNEMRQAVSLYRYSKKRDDEVSVISGDPIQALECAVKGWTRVRLIRNGSVGYLPTCYIKEVQ